MFTGPGHSILRLLRFLRKLNLMGTKIVYIYRVLLSPRGEKYLDIHMYRRYGHFLIFLKKTRHHARACVTMRFHEMSVSTT